jgi:predicted flap endonuclease-1-like 5' DNA nuclease
MATGIRLMTFIVPESGSISSGGWPAVGAAWTYWQFAPSIESFGTDIAEANLHLFKLSFDLMLLPLTMFGAGASRILDTPPDDMAPEAPAIGVPELPFAASPGTEDVTGVSPALLDAPEGQPDDLLLIKGIGPKLNQLLNSLGVWHYRQIVSWTPAEVSWVNAKIDFKGRIQRERWQPQAAELMKVRKAA